MRLQLTDVVTENLNISFTVQMSPEGGVTGSVVFYWWMANMWPLRGMTEKSPWYMGLII